MMLCVLIKFVDIKNGVIVINAPSSDIKRSVSK